MFYRSEMQELVSLERANNSCAYQSGLTDDEFDAFCAGLDAAVATLPDDDETLPEILTGTTPTRTIPAPRNLEAIYGSARAAGVVAPAPLVTEPNLTSSTPSTLSDPTTSPKPRKPRRPRKRKSGIRTDHDAIRASAFKAGRPVIYGIPVADDASKRQRLYAGDTRNVAPWDDAGDRMKIRGIVEAMYATGDAYTVHVNLSEPVREKIQAASKGMSDVAAPMLRRAFKRAAGQALTNILALGAETHTGQPRLHLHATITIPSNDAWWIIPKLQRELEKLAADYSDAGKPVLIKPLVPDPTIDTWADYMHGNSLEATKDGITGKTWSSCHDASAAGKAEHERLRQAMIDARKATTLPAPTPVKAKPITTLPARPLGGSRTPVAPVRVPTTPAPAKAAPRPSASQESTPTSKASSWPTWTPGQPLPAGITIVGGTDDRPIFSAPGGYRGSSYSLADAMAQIHGQQAIQ